MQYFAGVWHKTPQKLHTPRFSRHNLFGSQASCGTKDPWNTLKNTAGRLLKVTQQNLLSINTCSLFLFLSSPGLRWVLTSVVLPRGRGNQINCQKQELTSCLPSPLWIYRYFHYILKMLFIIFTGVAYSS